MAKIRSVLGRVYEIVNLINKGGMGEVYLGIHRELDKKRAVKIIHKDLAKDEEFRKRFYQEAKLAASLDHPGIIDIYDFGATDDFDYIIMPYIEGMTLRDKLIQEGRSEPEECIRLMILITDALGYAHDNNVIHRDIKPSNIMIDKQGKAIITDFGVSKSLKDDLTMHDTSLTLPGKMVGSPQYMSPEQIKGLPADKRSDLYSLGIVFYEMITGCFPFKSKDTSRIYETPCKPEEHVPDIPDKLANIIMKLIENSPDVRYQDCHELLDDLRMCQSAGYFSEKTQPVQLTGSKGFNLFQVKKQIALVLAFVFGAGIIWILSLPDRIEPNVSEELNNKQNIIQVTEVSFEAVLEDVKALGRKKEAAFLKLWTDKENFRIGDSVSYHFQSEKDCYVVILNLTTSGELIQIFPNKFNPDQFVQRDTIYSIPEASLDIALEITGPPGKDELIVLAAEKPFNLFSTDFENQPFFALNKEDHAQTDKISSNIRKAEKLDLAQKRITYWIDD
ncbi:MAG: protein kinase [Desulfobacteraceae bacterium]|nr:protein kinase [Desulfobacteraceae bacterium]